MPFRRCCFKVGRAIKKTASIGGTAPIEAVAVKTGQRIRHEGSHAAHGNQEKNTH